MKPQPASPRTALHRRGSAALRPSLRLGALGISRIRLLLLCFFAAFGVSRALANPIFIDDKRRPLTILSEKVAVTVGAGKSRVSGEFRIQQETPFTREQTYATIFVPVLLPDTLPERQYQALYGVPRVEIAGRRFSTLAWNDTQLEGSPESARLPRGWRMETYVCDVPLRIVGETFEVKVSYIQPHFPNDVAAYIPIRPPRDAAASHVTFSAESGRELRQLSFLSSRKSTLQFTPRDRRLIRVQSLKELSLNAPQGR